MTGIDPTKRRVLCLTAARRFRTARAWHWRVRCGALTGGRERPPVEPGAWLLELGPAEIWLGDDRTETEYLYRLASGEVVALDHPLTGEEAVAVTDPRAIAAMNAYRSLDEALLEDMGVALRREQPGLPPFALVKCPLCGGADFVSVDLASVWCDGCNAQFRVRATSGDAGFVVDCFWDSYSFASAWYVMPRVASLYMCLVLKDSGDPRDVRHDPEGDCGRASREGACRPDALNLTGQDSSLRPGLHACRIGTLYDWKLAGAIPTPDMVGDASAGWEIDGQTWPRCASLHRRALDREEGAHLDRAIDALRRLAPEKWGDTIAALERVGQLSRGEPDPYLWSEQLPAPSLLGEGEKYLLHHWLLDQNPKDSYRMVCPAWYVVKPIYRDHYLDGWEVIGKDICPRCLRRVRADAPDAHQDCRAFWEKMGWAPSGVEAPTGEIVQEEAE